MLPVVPPPPEILDKGPVQPDEMKGVVVGLLVMAVVGVFPFAVAAFFWLMS